MDLLEILRIEHRRLEALLRRLEAALAEGRPEAERLCHDLCSGFATHEKIEDATLFREFREETGEPAALRAMEGEHRSLQEALRALPRAFEPPLDRARTAEAVRGFGELLIQHMRREEDVLFPLALDTFGRRRLVELGTAAEFVAPAPRAQP